MSGLLELLMGGPPPRLFDRDKDGHLLPHTRERNKLALHFDGDVERQVTILTMLSQMRLERYYDRGLLLAILMVLLGNGTIRVVELIGQ